MRSTFRLCAGSDAGREMRTSRNASKDVKIAGNVVGDNEGGGQNGRASATRTSRTSPVPGVCEYGAQPYVR